MSPVTTILELKPRRVKNIFICSGVVFWGFVQDDEAVVKSAAPLIGQRRDFDIAPFKIFLVGLGPQLSNSAS